MNQPQETAFVPCDDSLLRRVCWSAFHGPCLAVADGLGLFTAIAGGARSIPDVATSLKLEERTVDAMMALLASLGFLTRLAGGYYLTEVARHYLLPESPYYWGAFLRRIRENPIDCRRLMASMRSGAGDGSIVSVWESPIPPPERLRGFTEAMHAHSYSLAMRAVPARFGLQQSTQLLDVAGGSGSYSIAAVCSHPSLRAVLMDLPPVCDVARDNFARYHVAERTAVLPLDMFSDDWPKGFDAVLFSDILHDWQDERCAFLCAAALHSLLPGGRVLVHEMPLGDAKDGPLTAAAYSAAMISATAGRQRTAPELLKLLLDAGFTDVKVEPTCSDYALFEGKKP